MSKRRSIREIVETVRECKRLDDEGSSWGYKMFQALEDELTPGQKRRANARLRELGLTTFSEPPLLN